MSPSSSTKDNETKLTDVNYRLRKYMETSTLAKRITNSIKHCNLLFRNLTDVRTLFKEDIQAISALHQPCFDDNDFRVKLGGLAGLFQVNQKKWKPILKSFDPKIKRARGSTLLVKWLDEQKIPYDHENVKVWDAIINLRNASFPYHQTNRALIQLVEFFGQSFPINYPELYESILRKFLDSLEMLQRVLSSTHLLALRREQYKRV